MGICWYHEGQSRGEVGTVVYLHHGVGALSKCSSLFHCSESVCAITDQRSTEGEGQAGWTVGRLCFRLLLECCVP